MRRGIIAIVVLALAGCATTGSSDKSTMAVGYYDRGISHLQMKDYEKAIVEFQRSINTDPKYKMSYYAMGMTYDMMGKYDEAEKYYKESIDLDSDFSDAHNSLGTVYMKQKKWKEALKSFQRALSNKMYATPNITYVNMGDVYFTLEAIRCVTHWAASTRWPVHLSPSGGRARWVGSCRHRPTWTRP